MSLKSEGRRMLRVNDHQDAGVGTDELEEMREFVESSRKLQFEAADRQALYGLMERVLKNQGYGKLRKGERGIVCRFLLRVSGLSRAQTARLIGSG